jgi:hypothetical protein
VIFRNDLIPVIERVLARGYGCVSSLSVARLRPAAPRAPSSSLNHAASAPTCAGPSRWPSVPSRSRGARLRSQGACAQPRCGERLRSRGVRFVDSENEVPLGAVCVLSAHGVSPAVRTRAAERGLRIVDATCPLVAKVYQQARRHAGAERRQGCSRPSGPGPCRWISQLQQLTADGGGRPAGGNRGQVSVASQAAGGVAALRVESSASRPTAPHVSGKITGTSTPARR